MMDKMGLMYVRMQVMLLAACEDAYEKFTNEEGDTNLISIVIILGIVLALVVVFRKYIQDILTKISTGVSSFNNDAFNG